MLFVSKGLSLFLFCSLLLACTPRTDHASKKDEDVVKEVTKPTPVIAAKPQFSKTLREAIYFSNSLEREALKLILKDNTFQKQTLFSVLSYIVETNSGSKKTTPFGLDCGQFLVTSEGRLIKIFKACEKPAIEIARIQTIEEENLYEVEFLIKDWANVVGLPVTLTSDNLRCQLRVREKKLYGLKCDNWSYLTQSDQLSSTIVKAREFVFQRDAKKQFVIKGGFFKELVEYKKLDIMVPLEGKIKIFEKELQVIDEFANKMNEESRAKHEKEEQYKEHISEEGAKKISEAASQESSQESNQQNKQEVQKAGEGEEQTGPQGVPEVSNPEGGSRGGRGR